MRGRKDKEYLNELAYIFAAVGWVAGLVAIHLTQVDAACKMYIYAGYLLLTAFLCRVVYEA